MPIVLKNSKHLLYLDLEGNHFSRIIPTWVGHNLRNLRVLKLRGNMFNGTIPSSLCLLPHLQILDLAHNQLQGNIPPNLSGFSVMTGKVPSEFVSCDIVGCVFTAKGGEQYLKSREMDYSFSQLALMVNIDLSNNSLVGFIPCEITRLTNFDGNPKLCGDPLPVKCVNEKPYEPPHGLENADQEEDEGEKWLLYVIIMLGFATGFWAVVGSLVLKRSLRYAYFISGLWMRLNTRFVQQYGDGGAKLKEICIHK
ncbi:probable LRR receptor-like serine/threonine-protein kinase At4g36180 [Momordica charantia]|uniref:Probable LRR receptor-like serine/threonine-protein kinase At4g36180 n=1 Tax=Momordica charantia TaxID=3673 RepID=A0A6J1DMM0_MOMCH|nr:probable LRR receptor-like serine/threonine-protein kinase At4g36180 [Momordica charantia]